SQRNTGRARYHTRGSVADSARAHGWRGSGARQHIFLIVQRAHSGLIKKASTMTTQKTGLVVTAHPGDFVWRAGGAIALHAKRGYRVELVCVSFGERGESQFAWKKGNQTLAEVKAARRDEAEKAAAVLGAEIESFDAGDYPLRVTQEMLDRL